MPTIKEKIKESEAKIKRYEELIKKHKLIVSKYKKKLSSKKATKKKSTITKIKIETISGSYGGEDYYTGSINDKIYSDIGQLRKYVRLNKIKNISLKMKSYDKWHEELLEHGTLKFKSTEDFLEQISGL